MANWLEAIDQVLPLDTLLRLVIAMLAGAVIGWEREREDKPAGLRTHILVSLGAAVFMLGAIELTMDLKDQQNGIRLDPIRALAGIIGGVGFLGAGSIIQSRGEVQGITTAASIWVSAAIGTSCGMGRYRLAMLCCLMSLAVLWLLGRVEHRVLEKKDADLPLGDR